MINTIKRIKDLDDRGLMASKKLRAYMEKAESELIRGLNKILVLSIINQARNKGEYGYNIIKEIERQTNNALVLEEGALYPLLRQLKDNELLETKQETIQGRNRTYYIITPKGVQFYNRMAGFFTKITESLSPILDVDITLKHDKYFYCPMCANKIELEDSKLLEENKYCVMCGHNLFEDFKNRRLEK